MSFFFFFSSRRRHTRLQGDWSSDVCSSDLPTAKPAPAAAADEAEVAYGSDIDLPLSSVLKGLPPDLKERLRDLDIRGATMTISLERILEIGRASCRERV